MASGRSKEEIAFVREWTALMRTLEEIEQLEQQAVRQSRAAMEARRRIDPAFNAVLVRMSEREFADARAQLKNVLPPAVAADMRKAGFDELTKPAR